MSGDPDDSTGPTRREYVKYGEAALGSGLLAGCTENAEPESTATATDTPTQTTESTTPVNSSYSVSMEPVGEVTFESVFDRQRVADIANGGSRP